MKIVWTRSIGWNMSFNGINKLLPPGYVWEKVKITQIIEDGPDCYPWREVYAWWPTKTVSGKYVWRKKLYKRKVWVRWGVAFHSEPFVQYATDFDIIAGNHDIVGKESVS